MANPEHLKKLKEGVEAWNEWRKENPKIIPDLSGTSLREADLSGANLNGTDLRAAILRDMNLISTNLAGANLTKAIICNASIGAANLKSANLTQSDLREANLLSTEIRDADLSGAILFRTAFSSCNLQGANFNGSLMFHTSFVDVSLSEVKGLDTVKHTGPSTIGIDTIYRSQGKIPEIFLRGAGVPENFITYMRSLAAEPFDYYSCFISYSNKDQGFAERLHSAMQAKGVRCWFAPEDLKTGDEFRQCIDEAIRIYDKLLVVLSENSIQSSWVKDEVEAALEKERRQNKLVLFPVRLDDAVMKTNLAWAASLRRTRHIGDFTKWKEHDNYQTAFQRLLRDLQGEAARGTSTGAP